MAAISDDSQKIGEFIDWLGNTNKMFIGEWTKYDDGVPIKISTEQLLAKYFKIDLNKVEKEKRQMLENIRSGRKN